MDMAIIIVWWAALVLALILTLIILKLVVLIVRTEREILQLARIMLPAARGIEANTSLISQLEATKGVAGKILGASVAIEASTSSIGEKLRSVARALSGRGL